MNVDEQASSEGASVAVENLPITAAVLAGGKSLRMGTDKRAIMLDGEPMLSRVVNRMSELCDHIVVVVGATEDRVAKRLVPARAEVVVDCVAGLGPLAGLVTALARANSEWVLVVAADMPLLKPQVLRLLWDHRFGADAVVPMTSRGLEPLCALYSLRCFAPALDLLGTPKGGPRRLLDAVRTVEVPEAALRAVDPELDSFVNVNTPDDIILAALRCGLEVQGLRVPPRVSNAATVALDGR